MSHAMETEYPRVEVQLPLSLDALISAESQVDVFVDQLKMGRDESLAFALRLVVNEGFRNALNAQPLEGRLKVIRLSLRGCQEGVWISITEPGQGIEFDGVFPPYPDSMIGREISIAQVPSRELVARMASPTRLVLRIESRGGDEHDTRAEILRNSETTGMGILALCRVCGEVNMTYDAAHGNTLNAFFPVNLESVRVGTG